LKPPYIGGEGIPPGMMILVGDFDLEGERVAQVRADLDLERERE